MGKEYPSSTTSIGTLEDRLHHGNILQCNQHGATGSPRMGRRTPSSIFNILALLGPWSQYHPQNLPGPQGKIALPPVCRHSELMME